MRLVCEMTGDASDVDRPLLVLCMEVLDARGCDSSICPVNREDGKRKRMRLSPPVEATGGGGNKHIVLGYTQ